MVQYLMQYIVDNLSNYLMKTASLKRYFSILIFTFVFVLFTSLFLSKKAFATYSSIGLSPSSGTIYGTETAIAVVVNSQEEGEAEVEFDGVDVNLSFTGNVEYIRGVGASRCDSFNITTPSSGVVNIECLSLNHEPGEGYRGTIATLYFKSLEEGGTSTFTFTSTDPEIVTKGGGSYDLTLAENTAPTDGEDGDGLPDAGLFDDTKFVILGGLVLVLFGIFFNNIANSFILVQNNIEEGRVEKRRKRLEKDF
jgi:hypothetical protein